MRGLEWPGTTLHLTFEGCVAERHQERAEPTIDLHAPKMAMAAAHPDAGGTNEAFIEARRRYLRAKAAAEAPA